MVCKSFYTGIVLIGISIIGTAYLTGWLFFNTNYIHSIIFLHILFVLEFIWLIRFVNKTNRMLDRFFSSIYEDGTSIKFENTKEENTFKVLTNRLNNIIELIKRTKIEKENEHHYLKYLVEHLNTGILSIENNNRIDVINKTGLKILGVKNIFTIDDFKQFGKKFYHAIQNIRAGEHQLIPTIVNSEIIDFSIRASEFKLFNRLYKIISFHDIHEELDQKEIDAWQKVIKVMAHEILSSVSPIRSLSQHLNDLLEKDKEKYLPDTVEGLKIIQQRSNGLMSFVRKYRQISDIPEPVFKRIKINNIINELAVLSRSEFGIESILKIILIDQDVAINIDKNLFIQAILNIVRNSVQAIRDKNSPEITVAVYKKKDYVNIEIKDNGIGVDEEDLENIFIPFFTTKEGGSGIGLTVAKQLTIVQGGRIEISSKKGIGTTVLFQFRISS